MVGQPIFEIASLEGGRVRAVHIICFTNLLSVSYKANKIGVWFSSHGLYVCVF